MDYLSTGAARPFLIDTHIHTSEVSPCGRVSARKMVHLYRQAGYDGLVITDHLTGSTPVFSRALPWKEKVRMYLSGFRIAEEAGEEFGLSIFSGMEVTLDYRMGNDFLVYGIGADFLLDHPNLHQWSPETLYQAVSSAGGLLIQAHPFRTYCAVLSPELLDGVEVFNGNPRHDSHNQSAEDFAAEFGLLRTGGSDAHQRADIARGGMLLPRKPSSIEDFALMIREGRAEIVGDCDEGVIRSAG